MKKEMKQPKKIRMMIICLLWIGISILGTIRIQVHAEETESIENAKAGIIEVFSGFYDPKGEFRKLQSGSGFLVQNTDNDTYIVTNASIVTISDNEKKEYCKKEKIKIERDIPATVVKIIVKGDVSVEANLVVESREKDFCILSIQNVVSEKKALKLENYKLPEEQDGVYALGFPNEDNLDYIPSEVECSFGTVEEEPLNWNNVLHLQHTAHLSEGCIGGPLLNESGYVVGMNCKKTLKTGTEVFCTLPIEEITEVLDNFSIYYESSLRDQWKIDLEQLYLECKELYKSKGYQKESLEKLKLALTDVEKLQEKSEEETAITEIEQAYQGLEDAKKSLVLKVEKLQIAIYVLAGIILLLFIWVVVLFILRFREKKKGGRNIVETTENQLPKEGSSESLLSKKAVLENESCQRMGATHQNNRKENENIQQESLALIHLRSGQSQVITEVRMIVGKSIQKADFSIPDNKMVSREHAAFQQQNGKYYIYDIHSANGTFVNGKRIPVESHVEIKAGDQIVLANEKFEVR